MKKIMLNTLLGVDLSEPVSAAVYVAYHKVRDETHPINNTQEASGSSTPKNDKHATRESSDDDSTTKKRDQDENTRDLECTSSDRLLANKEFVADIDGVGMAVVPDGDPNGTEHVLGTKSQSGDERTATLHKCTTSDRLLANKEFVADIDGVGTAVVPDGDPNDSERVLGTESQYGDERTAALHKCSNLAGGTVQIDEVQIQENTDPRVVETESVTIRTADLLASEFAGSWAVNTAPSVRGENEKRRSQGGNPDGNAAEALLLCSDGLALGSHSNVQSSVPSIIDEFSREHQALNATIEIVAPEFKQQFLSGCHAGGMKNESMSDAETMDGSDANENNRDGGGGGDDDDWADGDSVENKNEVIIEDSVR